MWVWGACAGTSPVAAPDGPWVLQARSRRPAPGGSDAWTETTQTLRWDPKRTAVIICDMWDNHNCKSAARRVGQMVPRLNALTRAARARGALIVHAPSDTTEKFYAGAPERRPAREAPPVPLPPGVTEIKSCRFDATREGPFPFDNERWGCDDEPQCPSGKPYPWTRQHPGIEVAPEDVISESGREIYNLFRQRGITQVVMTGVHTNYCVLGRSFGIRQMVLLGIEVVLVRDLTDSLYNPRDPPRVSHERGTELVVEHIEKYWCGSILSRDVVGD
jgi:nicotinamidase-related amidase